MLNCSSFLGFYKSSSEGFQSRGLSYLTIPHSNTSEGGIFSLRIRLTAHFDHLQFVRSSYVSVIIIIMILVASLVIFQSSTRLEKYGR